jgi:DNA-directed RNA polymerase subunit RPC12/RpoP
MVPTAVVAEVKRLLNEGTLSYRKISEKAGVSRGVVQAIASGRRPDYEELKRQRSGEHLDASGPPARCPHCGHRVFLPCRGCRLQVQVDRERSLRKFRAIWTNAASKLPPHIAAELRRWREP